VIGIRSPIRQKLVQSNWIDDGAGQGMCTNFGRFFQYYYASVCVQLFEANRRRQSRGASAHNDDIIFHDFSIIVLIFDVCPHRLWFSEQHAETTVPL